MSVAYNEQARAGTARLNRTRSISISPDRLLHPSSTHVFCSAML